MAKEFDIYLNKRLTKCDVIVYSIPFRDGLTVMGRLILETCLESYLLNKFIAIQSGSALVSHIDKMIKICLERLKHGIAIDTSAEFQVHYSLRPKAAIQEISAEHLNIMATVYESAENILQLKTVPINAYVKRPFGCGQFETEVKSDVASTFKQILEKASHQLDLCAESLGIKKSLHEKVELFVAIGSEATDSLCRVYSMSTMAVDIAAQVVEAEICFSIGRSEFPIIADNKLLDEQITKFVAMESIVNVLLSVTEHLIQCINPEPDDLNIMSEVEFIFKRYRLLQEMDSDALFAYDDMSLDDVYYITL